MATSKTKGFQIKGYTTQVSASRSLDQIEKLLVKMKATNINKKYDPETETCIAIMFIINVGGMHMPFKLPARVAAIEKILRKNHPQSDTLRLAQRAEMVAWKLIYEWLQVQFSVIAIEQAELIEVLLPYVYDFENDETFFEKAKKGGYRALLPPPPGT